MAVDAHVAAALKLLRANATKATRDGMARYGIPSDHALGVTMARLKVLAKQLGPDHSLALGLWKTGVYEARMLAALIDDPALVTATQMDDWCGDFDNWGICDTVCFALFDRTPHAWKRVAAWQRRTNEFEKRAAFALIWGLTVHDKTSTDAPFVQALGFIEKGALDERHLVKKSVSMALRAIGKRNAALNASALGTARKLMATSSEAASWIGRDALRELSAPALAKRLAKSPKKSVAKSPGRKSAGTPSKRAAPGKD